MPDVGWEGKLNVSHCIFPCVETSVAGTLDFFQAVIIFLARSPFPPLFPVFCLLKAPWKRDSLSVQTVLACPDHSSCITSETLCGV